MLKQLEKVVIVGAELKNGNYYDNVARTSELRTELLERGLAFDGIVNVNHDGTREQKFVVVTNDIDGLLQLARNFQQPFITVSDASRSSFLLSTSDALATIPLGLMKNVTLSEAKDKGNSYLVVRDNGTEYYFITEQP